MLTHRRSRMLPISKRRAGRAAQAAEGRPRGLVEGAKIVSAADVVEDLAHGAAALSF